MSLRLSRRAILQSLPALALPLTWDSKLHAEGCDDGSDSCDDIQPPAPYLREFDLPVPLFCKDSVWRTRVDNVNVKQDSAKIVESTFNSLEKLGQNFCYLNWKEWSIPIFEAQPGSAQLQVFVNNYAGGSWGSSTLTTTEVNHRLVISGIPKPAGRIRPAGPRGLDSDGHLVLYDVEGKKEYDFWQATTCRNDVRQSTGAGCWGDAILETGGAECFDVTDIGAIKTVCDKQLTSARATGVPLLAGLLLPEDIANGSIEHPLVFSLPMFRGEVDGKCSFVYPASKTEKKNPVYDQYALGAGERIRLKRADSGQALLDINGNPINEACLAPITVMFLKALREYGAYLVDGAGAFTFYAEDIHTAHLKLDSAEVNRLAGRQATHLIEDPVRKWKLLMRRLTKEISRIPFAVEVGNVLHSNFDPIEDAVPPPGWQGT